jgi:hypothetical protein
MRARFAALVAAIAVIPAVAPAHPVGATFADLVGSNGTNWDNSISCCR